MSVDFSLLHYQDEFIRSNSKKSLLLGGIGSGKSYSGGHFGIRMLSEYPRTKGLLTANTYQQLFNATVPTFCEQLDLANIPNKPVLSGAKKRIETNSTIIYLYSLEKHDSIRGIEVGWWLGDESCFAKKEAIKVCRGRLRQPASPLFERHTSSPNGFNWAYDDFENFDGNKKTKKNHLIRAITKENCFLPDDYYEDLLEEYGGESNPLAMQELFGQFVNLIGGQVYWGFNRERNVKHVKPDRKYPVYIGQDFNIDNMRASCVQRIDGKYKVFKEIILDNYGANTDTAAQKIIDLFPSNKWNVKVVPDSTGKAIKTSSSNRSDIEILESYGLEVISTRNPFIRDRQNAVNMQMKKNLVEIDPSCKTTIKEIETLSSRDKEGEKAHSSVGLGYIINKFSPLRRTQKSTFRRY